MTSDHGTAMLKTLLAGSTLAVLSACTSAPPATAPARSAPPPAGAAPAPAPAAPGLARTSGPRYRCDHDIGFTVEFGQDAATVDSTGRGREVLLRDAGGVTPQQTVYSNERVKAEFGLGSDGKDAILRFAEPALVAHCTRQ